MSDLPEVQPDLQTIEPSALAGHYLRAFAGAVGSMSDFEPFLDALKQLVVDDPFFRGGAELSDTLAGAEASVPDFEKLDSAETVVSVAGESGNLGYLKYSGRSDGAPFGAEDMHLMGSIAGFISALVSQAHKVRQQGKLERVLQYLFNQLPLGVVCFDTQGELIVQSKSAGRLLGDEGVGRLSDVVSSGRAFVKGRAQLHFDVQGKLVYSEGRRLPVEDDLDVIAFVLYDLSSYREKLLMDLEREAFRSESRKTRLTLALLEVDGEAGAIYRKLRGAAESLQLEPARIQPVGAYTCACIFADQSPRVVRFLLKAVVGKIESVRVSLLQYEPSEGKDSPADSMIKHAKESLETAESALLPQVAVLDPYPAVSEALSIITSEACQLVSAESIDAAAEMISSGSYDGLFLDLDSFELEELRELQHAASEAGGGFKIFYTSHKQPAMAREAAKLDSSETVFQKPFRADELAESLSLQFDLA